MTFLFGIWITNLILIVHCFSFTIRWASQISTTKFCDGQDRINHASCRLCVISHDRDLSAFMTWLDGQFTLGAIEQ